MGNGEKSRYYRKCLHESKFTLGQYPHSKSLTRHYMLVFLNQIEYSL